MLSQKQIWGISIALILLTFFIVFGECWIFSMVYHGIIPFLLKSVVELKVWHILMVLISYKLADIIIGITFIFINKVFK